MDKKAKILDIAMNLNCIGNWAADDFAGKEKRIRQFLDQTNEYIAALGVSTFENPFRKTYQKFLAEYKRLEREAREGPKNELAWAEAMMTWGNILTHRSSQLSA